MDTEGVDVVLRRLSHAACDPEPVGTNTWTARCPVHGGKYRALVISRYANGSVSLRCRNAGLNVEPCSEVEVWGSLGLQPQRLECALAATAPSAHAAMAEPEPCAVSEAAVWEAQSGDAAGTVIVEAEATVRDAAIWQATVVAEVPRRPAQARPAGGKRARRDGRSLSRVFLRIARTVQVIRGLDGRLYGQVPVAGHQEVHELDSSRFRYWLIREYRRLGRAAPGRDSVNTLVRAFEAEAAELESAHTVWVRVADGSRHRGFPAQLEQRPDSGEWGLAAAGAAKVYYLDLGDSSWQSVEIRAEGCRILDRAPVFFRRPRGSEPLPRPEWDGSIDLLKKYTNLAEGDFLLFLAWVTAASRPFGPYPILILTGEQGSGKSTMACLARRLVDPSSALAKGPPSDQHDLMLQAHNNWVLVYDNLSSISTKFSDSLCRIASGSGFSTRSLYSNDSETLFSVQRPVIITCIEDLLHRSDLIDRCLVLHLPALGDLLRRSEEAFWAEFYRDWPRLAGAILTAVSRGLRTLPQVTLPALPRMADFALWGEAVSRGLGGERGSFLARYLSNRRAAIDSALDDCEVAQALLRGMAGAADGSWRGTAADLLPILADHARQGATKTAQWPKTPQYLSIALRRIVPQLRTIGITVNFDRIDSIRMITVQRSEGR
jgi:hypothetical protein